MRTKNKTKKELKKYTQKNFYFYLMDYIRDNERLPTDEYSSQHINYYLKTLKSLCIVYKIGYGVWHIDEEKYKIYRFNKEFKTKKIHHVGTDNPKNFKGNPLKKIRGHGFVFTLPIKVKNWEKRIDFLRKNKINYTIIPQGQRIDVKNNKVWLCNNSIVVYFREDLSFYGRSALESLEYAKNEMNNMCNKLENILKIKLNNGSGYKFKISRNHFARMQDLMAVESNKRGGLKLYYDGKLWLLTDRSFNIDETECVHSKTAVSDNDNIISPMLQGLKEHYEKTGEALTLNGLLSICSQQQNQITELTKTVNSLLYVKPKKLDPKDSYFG